MNGAFGISMGQPGILTPFNVSMALVLNIFQRKYVSLRYDFW
jgi:hypothetical protein